MMDDLRALADALEPMARAPRFDDIDVPALCAWMRACANVEPAAWMSIDSIGERYLCFTRPHDNNQVYPLYLHHAPAAPQAEPKREPLSDWRIGELYRQWLANPETVTITDLMRAVERAAYERAAQECIETAAELRRCADGCTDGRYDWKADGADDCAAAIRALGRQHD